MRFVAASDTSLLVVVAGEASMDASARVHALFRALSASPPPWLLDLHPAYASVLVDFDLAAVDHAAVEAHVAALASSAAVAPDPSLRMAPGRAPGKTVTVPVRYDGADLAFVAEHTGLTIDDVVARHTAAAYTVAFLGFMPGFAYLLGLDARLAVPRLDVPRPRVPAGAVAVAAAQAAVYPAASPGGWRILGHTERVLTPDWVDPGDAVRFTAAS